MKFTLQSELSCLVAAHHKHVSITVNCNSVAPPASDGADVAAGLLVGLGLLVEGGPFVGYRAPRIDYVRREVHYWPEVIAA